jgi:hypothetical protein
MVKIGSKSGQSTASTGGLPAEESRSTDQSTEHDEMVDQSTRSTEITDASMAEESTGSISQSTGSTTDKHQRQAGVKRSTGQSTKRKDHESTMLVAIPVGDIVFLLHTLISAYKNPEHKKSRARSTNYITIAEWLDKVDANWHRFIPIDSFLKRLENKRTEVKENDETTEKTT